jgi:hypothetical protein
MCSFLAGNATVVANHGVVDASTCNVDPQPYCYASHWLVGHYGTSPDDCQQVTSVWL